MYFLFAIVLIAGTMGARAQVDEGLKALIQLNDRIIALYNVGKFAEALPLQEHYVKLIRDRLGPERAEYATALDALIRLYNRSW